MHSSPDRNFIIVGIGASAGGLEALENLFKNLDPNLDMAYVVIQHLSPDYKSMMVELLSKHTAIPIQHASPDIPVRPGNIYLIPPKKNIRLEKGVLKLSDIHHSPGNLNLPIDTFFLSLAEERGEKSIGIILSGTGSDGTRGIRKIKEKGGLVIVQDDTEAKFDGMPRSAIATGLVDYILSVDRIGSVLSKFIHHPLTIENIEPIQLREGDGYQRILTLIRRISGIDFTHYKSATVTRRIARRMSLNQFTELSDYITYLEGSTRELEILQRELLIGVTNFFRDPEAFEVIQTKVIPTIFEAHTTRDQIRFWVTACSTGEEAYSLAILAKDYMKAHNIRYDVKIFATDVDPFALKTAGIGIYTDSIAADISEDRLKSYFIKKGNIYQVSPEIREMVIFAPQNLLKDPPFSRIDLISCRNLLIYLHTDAQKKILQMFHFSLKPAGFMFLGSSESLGELSNIFTDIHPKWKIFQSKPGSQNYSLSLLNQDTSALSHKTSYPNALSGKGRKEDKTMEKVYTQIIESYVPPCAIVNDAFQIIHVIGDVSSYLKVQSGRMNFDITNMVDRGIKIALSAGLRKVFTENREIAYNNIHLEEDFNKKHINISIKPVPFQDTDAKLALVLFQEISTSPNGVSLPVSNVDIDEKIQRRILELEQELEFNRENLQATIEQLETSNEELQATNEELLAANEELQSTNEELQSVNEELVTLNSEHHSKIMELMELNNDINNLLSNTDIGVIFLDNELNIRKFTPAAQKIINLMASDKGRPISHISHKFHETIALHEQSAKVLKTLIPIEAELTLRKEGLITAHYLARFLPYRTIDNKIMGVVISLIDISDLKRAETYSQTQNRLRSEILETIRESIITTNLQFQIQSWNLYSESLFGYTEAEAVGKDYFALIHPNFTKQQVEEVKSQVIHNGHLAHSSLFVKKGGEKIEVFTMKDLVHSVDGLRENIIIISRKK